MLEWFVRMLFVVAGFITSFFVARDALNFGVIQMTIAILLFTILVFIIAFWPSLKKEFMKLFKK